MKFISKVWHLINLAYTFLTSHFSAYVLPAIQIVEQIKTAVNDPSFDILFSLTNSHKDETFLQLIREVLSNVISELIEIKDQTPEDIIRHLIEYLRDLTPDQRNLFYHKIASRIASALSPEEIKESEADTLVQLAYLKTKIDNTVSHNQ